MGGFGHLYHTVRMTDGGLCPVHTRPEKQKNRFLPDNGGPRRSKVASSSLNCESPGICRRSSETRPMENTLVVGNPCLGKTTVHTQWWSPWWVRRSRDCQCSETSWTREGDCNRRVHNREYLTLFYFALAKCSSYTHSGCVHFQFSRCIRRMKHNLYYKHKNICL